MNNSELEKIREETFKQKAAQRKSFAKESFENKLQSLVKLQRMNFVMKRAAGLQAPRPWNMSDEEYQRETIEY